MQCMHRMIECGQLTAAGKNSGQYDAIIFFHNANGSPHHLQGPLCIHKGSMNFELD